MILVGCELHTRKQQVALLNTDTGELWEQELSHDGDAIDRNEEAGQARPQHRTRDALGEEVGQKHRDDAGGTP